MFSKNVYRCVVLITGLLLGNLLLAQTLSVSDYNSLGGINLPVSNASSACPSLDSNRDNILEVSSLNTFRVLANVPDMGLPTNNTFEWAVYGGWITHINNNPITVGDHDFSRQHTTINPIRYSYILTQGVSNPLADPSVWEANITVEWDTLNFSSVNGWVAVRQSSEWGCTDGGWSVITNTIINTPPAFTVCPPNLILPYSLRSNYTLPMPSATDDGCNQPLYYTYVVDRPLSADIVGNQDNRVTDYLETGNNIVTWIVTDGSRTASCTYTITVEPPLEILNVAWTNPTCNGLSDGTLLVTAVTDYAFIDAVQYSINGNPYDVTGSFSGLGATTHTLQASVRYFIDIYNNGSPEEYFQESPTYTVTLTANAATAVDAIPDAVIINAGCLSSTDGKITVPKNLMTEQNNSVGFSGDDFLLINKRYNAPLTAFSVATWIKIAAGSSNQGTLISFDNEKFYQLSLRYFSSGNVMRVRFFSTSTGGQDNESFVHSKPVNDGMWHLIVATYNAGQHTLYVDGEKVVQPNTYGTSVGNAAAPRYGTIGVDSKIAGFTPPSGTDYFKGDMAEMAIFDGAAISDVEVLNMMKHGIASVGGFSDHWALNSVPAVVSPTDYTVFTDLGNTASPTRWARFDNCVQSTNSSPKLLSWTDNLAGTNDDNYLSTHILENLAVGTYTLHVKGIFGCGELTRDFNILNNDLLPPELYWNAAIRKTATQLSTNGSNFASNAVDGLAATASLTNSENEVWWNVDLLGTFPVRMIKIYPGSSFSNFYVMASQSPFAGAGASTLAQDRAVPGVVSVLHSGAASGVTTIRLNANARYIRIRTVGTTALNLNQVEVLTNQTPVPPRVLYLGTGVCNYTITANDLSIAPAVYDVCGAIVQFYNSHNATNNLNGVAFGLGVHTFGDHAVTWTAIDDADLETNMDITYRVIDNTPPAFNPLPFASGSATITYCQSLAYSLLVPKVTDNYPLVCGPLTSLELWSGLFRAYEYIPIGGYNPAIDEYTGNINATNYLAPGDRVLQWRVRDYSNNYFFDQLNLHVEREPRLSEVKVSPITCNGANNAQVTFSKIESEKDVNPAVDVVYVLKSTVNPFDELPRQTNNPVFNNVPFGTYQAFFEVNGCRSNIFVDVINIVDPDPITVVQDITPVLCSGQNNGAIALTVNGGSQSNILHFLGGDGAAATSGNYAGLDLTGSGTIEGWVYLDTLGNAPGEHNYNAGLFGVLNGTHQGYGFKMINGDVVFYAGAVQLTTTITERQWVHLSGSWNEPTGTITLSVNGSQVNAGAVPPGFIAPVGGNVYFGSISNGDDTNILRGFVRNVRVWNRALTDTEIGNNLYLLDPIDINGNLKANYPLAAGGGTILSNRVPGGNTGTVNTTSYAWQRFAYYWENSGGNFVGRTRNIAGLIYDTYTVHIDDPMGCARETRSYPLTIKDITGPTMTFSNLGHGGTPLTEGQPIVRYTSYAGAEDPHNIAGDCLYYPFAKEFDPLVSDGECPAEDVTLSWTVITGAFDPTDPPAVDAQSLDGVSMTDIIRLQWRAQDLVGNFTTQLVDYYSIDNEAPVLTWSDQTRSTDPGECGYTVTITDTDILPVMVENCTTGRLYNNINGLDNLVDVQFVKGTHTIRWIYEDKTLPGGYFTAQSDTVEYTLTVEDNEDPQALCKPPFIVQLDATGTYTIDYLDVDDGSGDNCGTLAAIHITKNVAYGKTASQIDDGIWDCGNGTFGPASNAVDGNTSGLWNGCSVTHTSSAIRPWWQVDLGVEHTIYQIRLFNRSDCCPERLANFYVLISDNPIAAPPADWGDPVWPADVKAHYFSGIAGASEIFDIPSETGRYVRVWNGNEYLSLAEVEVYGTTNPASAANLSFNCTDVRYTPNVNPDLQGTFNPIGVLLSAIDNQGNVTSCMTNVTVEDRISPTVIPKIETVYLDAFGNVDLSTYINSIDDGSSDACGIASRWMVPNDLNCLNIGNNNVRLYVRDIYGNTANRVTVVIVADNTPPTYTLKSNIQLPLDADGNYTILPSDIFADVNDNCTIDANLIYSFNPATVTCSNIGFINLTATITDGSGSVATVVFDAADPILANRIQVVDLLPPVASIANFQLIIQADGDSMIRFQDIIPDANLYDNCDKYVVPVKRIKYDASDNWCPAGDEGTDVPIDFTNKAVSTVTGYGASSAAYSGTQLSNLHDDVFSTAAADVYISDSYSGTRSVYYYLDDTYEFDQSSIRWNTDNTLSTTQIDLSTNNAAIDYNTPSNNSEAADGGYSLTSLIDGDMSIDANGSYVTSGNWRNGNDGSVYLDFNSSVTVSSVLIYWTGFIDTDDRDAFSPDRVRLYRSNDGNNWTEIDDQNLSLGNNNPETSTFSSINASLRYLRIRFYENESTRHQIGIREIQVNGFDQRENCVLPTTNTLYYSSNSGTDWTSAGSFSAAAASTFYDLALPVVSANAFRLDMTTTPDSRVGIQEWRINGREINADNACVKHYCDVVHTNVPVWLQWADNSGNIGSTNITVPAIPYFDLVTLDIKDCGYDGERYYPTITGLAAGMNYSYTWNELQALANNGTRYALFQKWHCSKVGLGELPYTMPTAGQEWIGLITTGCTPYPADGDNYAVSLTVADGNGCWDYIPYYFQYRVANTLATSFDSAVACINEVETYGVKFPIQWSFWRYNNREFFWDSLANLVTAGQITVVDGGRSLGDPLSPRGDDFVTLTFDRSTTDVGSTTNFTYRYRAMQFTGGVATPGPNLLTGTGATVNFRLLVVLDSLETGGPYWTEATSRTSYTNMPAGTKYVRVNSEDWFGDFTNCMESRQYRVTVYEVTPPVIYAYDAYASPPAWIPAADLVVCPRDTVWYRVQNIATGDYTAFSWSLLSADATPVATGRRLAQGNFNDDSIQIVWDQFPIRPRLAVRGRNVLNCDSDSTVITHLFTDTNPPVLGVAGDCSALNIVGTNTPGQCQFTFQNLPPPLITDDCRNRIANYWNTVNMGKNAAGVYPVGITPVTWYATDYSTNEGNCSHTVTVLDTEAPQFDKIPVDITRYAAADNCTHTFAGTSHDVTAEDNCLDNTVTLLAEVFHWNGVDFILQEGDLTTIDGVIFQPGLSQVVWTANDGVDNSAYVGYSADGNEAIVNFYVTVSDNTKPVITDSDGVTPGVQLQSITTVSDAGLCSAALTIRYPGYDAGGFLTDPDNLLFDNCTADANLIVEFVSRSDARVLTAPFNVGTTTINWRVSDTATPTPNRSTATQTVTVTDIQEPWFNPADPYLQNVSIGYCTRATHKLGIPRPYDNCSGQVKRITWNVTDGAAYNQSGTILRSASPNFNPNGDFMTGVIPTLNAVAATGTNYIVTWTIEDEAGNTNTLVSYSYTLRVEIEPYFNDLLATAMSCGNANDGKITVVTASNYRAEPGYPVYYTINNWQSSQQDNPIFENLTGGTYNVQMRVNGCFSQIRQATITQPEVYGIVLTVTAQPYCYEDETGTIDLVMTGGAAGQLRFSGGGVSAGHYVELDLTSTGAIEAWVYLESLNDALLIAKGTDYSIRLLGGKFTIDVNGAYLGDAAGQGAGIEPALRRWYFVSGSWDAGSNNMYLYVNGASQGGAVQGTLNDAPTNTVTVNIGNGFNGIIREVRISNTVSGGSHPASKPTGSEPELVAYWMLNEGGLNNTSFNYRSLHNASATPISGTLGLWNSTEPQPGYYSWTKGGVFYSNDIDLTGLGRGIYRVSFQDPYLCPNPALSATRTITPTDNESPLIAAFSNQSLFVDPGINCQRVITALEAASLRPDITDACTFITNWRIIPNKTLVAQTFNNVSNFAGAVLELGRNRVEVTASQYNGTVTSSSFYFIDVVDNIPPVAVGQNVTGVPLSNDNIPMGSGVVYYDSFNFNLSSSDNCTPVNNLTFELSSDGIAWEDELQFDCDDIGQIVFVWFRVTDLAVLTHVQSGLSMTVIDGWDPVFLGGLRPHQECATVDAVGVVPAYTQVSPGRLKLDLSDYTDNCSVNQIQYQLDHEDYAGGDTGWIDGDDPGVDDQLFYEGKTMVWFRIFDPSGNNDIKIMYEVTILPKPAPTGGIR